jgi:hypothetical protein
MATVVQPAEQTAAVAAGTAAAAVAGANRAAADVAGAARATDVVNMVMRPTAASSRIAAANHRRTSATATTIAAKLCRFRTARQGHHQYNAVHFEKPPHKHKGKPTHSHKRKPLGPHHSGDLFVSHKIACLR